MADNIDSPRLKQGIITKKTGNFLPEAGNDGLVNQRPTRLGVTQSTPTDYRQDSRAGIGWLKAQCSDARFLHDTGARPEWRVAGPSADEFASWLRPREVLSKLDFPGDATAKNEIAARILRGCIPMAAQSLSRAGAQERASQPSLIDPDYLHGPWAAEWGGFWSLGQISFVRVPTALGGFATLKIVGPTGSLGQPEIHTFRGVRLEPAAMAREFDLDLISGAGPQQGALPPARKGGRPAGKHGAPIARITLRMRAKTSNELRTYTADALSVELIEEYLTQGLDPPSEENARRDAAGILRMLRE